MGASESSIGEDFEHLGKLKMTQYSIGPQLGVKLYSQIIFFETERDLNNFVFANSKSNQLSSSSKKEFANNTDSKKKGGGVYEFGVDSNIVALVASAGANISTIGNESLSTRVNYSPKGAEDSKRFNYEFSLNDTLQYNKGLAA